MKTFVGVPVWNRVDQIVWLLDGIVQNFKPDETVAAFYFDNCTDGSLEHFNCVRERWLTDRGFPNYVGAGVEDLREVGSHNRLLKLFQTLPECDIAIICQDDQLYLKPVADNVRALFEQHPDLGVIGGRDGYERSYQDMAASEWSPSSAVKRKLKHGESVFRPLLNSGPIAYHRRILDKVGFLDDGYTAFYVWDDYCMRAAKHGFRSAVMGMDVVHKKVGRGKQTTFYTSEISRHDLGRLHEIHGATF